MLAAAKAGADGAAEEVFKSLSKEGADETIVDGKGRSVSKMIGEYVAEEDRLIEHVERLRELLTNAPADRAWGRRGYMVL